MGQVNATFEVDWVFFPSIYSLHLLVVLLRARNLDACTVEVQDEYKYRYTSSNYCCGFGYTIWFANEKDLKNWMTN